MLAGCRAQLMVGLCGHLRLPRSRGLVRAAAGPCLAATWGGAVGGLLLGLGRRAGQGPCSRHDLGTWRALHGSHETLVRC